ncbi:hypothetical protein OsJ_05066 [Oryza sativa Japonica Group]|uniref:Uncharacterized protein n=1 Tax=Oryza sativa subsp. japonica TaxID=39947 RepID=B9F1S5_ORYSJ|nr:hypothetical protein OsJ_05066 [Oryza sativa Japonica Group]
MEAATAAPPYSIKVPSLPAAGGSVRAPWGGICRRIRHRLASCPQLPIKAAPAVTRARFTPDSCAWGPETAAACATSSPPTRSRPSPQRSQSCRARSADVVPTVTPDQR